MRKMLLLVAVLAMVAAACSSDEPASTPDAMGSDVGPQAAECVTEQGEEPVDRPVIEVPDGDPPTELVIEDLEEGTGAEAVTGCGVDVHYVGVSWSTGEEFDASWNRESLFSFTIGAGLVITGWDEGVAGMKVGGRRQLTIPPDMGYGEGGSPPVIGPNETLIFVVDLVGVGEPSSGF